METVCPLWAVRYALWCGKQMERACVRQTARDIPNVFEQKMQRDFTVRHNTKVEQW